MIIINIELIVTKNIVMKYNIIFEDLMRMNNEPKNSIEFQVCIGDVE